MTSVKVKLPKYRHHKAKGLAAVTLDGRHIYLGPYDSPASHQRYRQLVSEWIASKQTIAVSPVPESVQGYWGVNSLVEAFLTYCRGYYAGNNAKPSTEYHCVVSALAPLSELHGLTNAHEFGARKLKEVRVAMIGLGWSRRVINSALSRIRRMFKWAVSEELIAPSVLQSLQSVSGLRAGRSTARETDPIKPVADEHVDAVLPYLHDQVRTMVELQRLTGMRPCEVVLIRPCDVDRSGDVWVYEPHDHKNLWRGHRRQVPLGPKAQSLLQPFLDRSPDAYCFSPREAEDERNAKRRASRRSPMTPSQAKRRPKAKPKRPKRQRYDSSAYRRAISRSITQVNKDREVAKQQPIPKWYPLQLRHTRATEVRRQYGLDGAQSALGHKNADITQVYAEKNLELAVRIARETG